MVIVPILATAQTSRDDPAALLVGVLGLLCVAFVALVAYFFPTAVAFHRRHHNSWAILVLNLLLGWSFVGWVASLVWACTVAEHRWHTSK